MCVFMIRVSVCMLLLCEYQATLCCAMLGYVTLCVYVRVHACMYLCARERYVCYARIACARNVMYVCYVC